MVIDFHTHCFADKIAENAVSTLEKQAGIKAVAPGTADGLRSYMRRHDVDLSVVLPVATKPSQIAAINRWAKEQEDGRLLFFGAVHPDDPDFEATVKSLKSQGFQGVKFHPDYQRFFADEPRMMPLYGMLRDAGLIVVLHAGIDIGYPSPVYCTPLMVRHVLDNVPGIRLVAAHMGGHALWRDVEELLVGRPVYLDTSYSCYLLPAQDMQRMISRHGAENVLFGTDYPWKGAQEEIANIRSLPLPASDIDKILYANAHLLLKLR
jgi:Predicted metal-dependent hydrolase of the TIM-barrel fold